MRCKLPGCGHIAFVAAVVVSTTTPAFANLRAPMHAPEARSSAMFAPVEGVSVVSEQLSFHCRATNPRRGSPESHCDVRARYTVRALEAIEVALDFIAPDAGTIEVLVAGAAQTATLVPYEAKTGQGSDEVLVAGQPPRVEPRELHKASFTAPLSAGEQIIEVRYRQPMGYVERGHGYRSNGDIIHRLTYEVWPLKQWQAEPGFKMDVEVRLERAAPGWWQRRNGRYQVAVCGPVTTKEEVLELEAKETDASVRYTMRFGFDELPDRLVCRFGPAHLLSNP
jgi:hypothetical protein